MKKTKNHGITLIALIVTIIILLILAGTAISLLSGQNGILQRSQSAVSQYRISAARELLDLKLLEIDADSYETNLRKATFVEIVEKLRDDAGFIIVGMDLGENPIFENNLVLPEDLNSLKAIFVCSTQYKDVIFKITNEREISIYDEKVDVEVPDPEEIGYQITYHKNDGSGEKQVQLLDKGVETSLGLNQFTRGGYTLEGWYANTECTGEKITTVSDNIEVYAKWVAKTAIESGGPTTIGDTTYTDSFEIWNKPQLENFRNRVNGGETFENCVVRQKADINLNSENWTPIGTSDTNCFSGTYDGEEHTIEGLYINSTDHYQGLFGYAEFAKIRNLTLGSGSVIGGNRVGGVVGYAKSSMIQNIHNQGTAVTAGTTYSVAQSSVNLYGTAMASDTIPVCSVGGICGEAENTDLQDCKNDASITGITNGECVGGIVGYDKSEDGRLLSNCMNQGTISTDTGIGRIGGIAGFVYGSVVIESCKNDGVILAENSIIVGGIVGDLKGTSAHNCENGIHASVTGKLETGGIAGQSRSISLSAYVTIENCKNLGNVTAVGYNVAECYSNGVSSYNASMVGGIVGNTARVNVTNCYNEGKVTSQNYCGVGGIVGDFRNGTISNCYNIAPSISGLNDIGGIVGMGQYNAFIHNCYNSGKIEGKVVVGGIIGFGAATDIRYCYNMKDVVGTESVGGIEGYHSSFYANANTNNYLWYCYNIGKVTGTKNVGSIVGYTRLNNINHTYSLKSTATSNIGGSNSNTAANHAVMLDKDDLIAKILSDFGEYFVEDKNTINEGYPILNWQS